MTQPEAKKKIAFLQDFSGSYRSNEIATALLSHGYDEVIVHQATSAYDEVSRFTPREGIILHEYVSDLIDRSDPGSVIMGSPGFELSKEKRAALGEELINDMQNTSLIISSSMSSSKLMKIAEQCHIPMVVYTSNNRTGNKIDREGHPNVKVYDYTVEGRGLHSIDTEALMKVVDQAIAETPAKGERTTVIDPDAIKASIPKGPRRPGA